MQQEYPKQPTLRPAIRTALSLWRNSPQLKALPWKFHFFPQADSDSQQPVSGFEPELGENKCFRASG
jgi:hypothetical protein